MSEIFGNEAACTSILVVKDLDQSIPFYRDVLGASLYREYGGTSAVFNFLNHWLLLVTEGGPTPDKPETHFRSIEDPDTVSHAFTIRVQNCEEVYKVLKSAGAEFITPPVINGAETRCFFRDPDGHLFEISEYRSTQEQTSGKTSPEENIESVAASGEPPTESQVDSQALQPIPFPVTVYWTKDAFKMGHTFFVNGRAVGDLKDSSMNRTIKAQIFGRKFLFESEGMFHTQINMIDLSNRTESGVIKPEIFRPRAGFRYNNRYYFWRFKGVMNRKWVLSDENDEEIMHSASRKEGYTVIRSEDELLLLLASLVIRNRMSKTGYY